jgi:hypothetical protein
MENDTNPQEEEITSPLPKRIPKTSTKEYYREYYHTHAKQIFVCPACNVHIQGNKSKLRIHQQSKTCKRFASMVETYSQMSLS